MTIRCSRCLYDENTPSISFGQNGQCNYCDTHDLWDKEYPIGEEGNNRLLKLAEEIKLKGKGAKYDCIVGVSGGCDSSFLLYKVKMLGLRPLAVHFDNTWNSTIATENIRNVLQALDIDLYTVVADNREYDDIYGAFIKSGVPDIEACTDIALAATALQAAQKFGIKYIIDGHSFRTEGVTPMGWLYMDGKYIETVHKQFGKLPMKTYPRMPLGKFLKWMVFNRIKRIRPLYFIDYRKEEVKKFLASEFGWKWYGGHHLENRFTAFYHSYFLPRRFGIDFRVLGYSALIRSGQMTREEGLNQLSQPPHLDDEILRHVKKRLNLSDSEFIQLMDAPKHTYREFKTYKKTFELLRPFFWVMMKLELVPKSFYLKFTVPDKSDPNLILNPVASNLLFDPNYYKQLEKGEAPANFESRSAGMTAEIAS
jgi:N-acetyl sugar amidotransferase